MGTGVEEGTGVGVGVGVRAGVGEGEDRLVGAITGENEETRVLGGDTVALSPLSSVTEEGDGDTRGDTIGDTDDTIVSPPMSPTIISTPEIFARPVCWVLPDNCATTKSTMLMPSIPILTIK